VAKRAKLEESAAIPERGNLLPPAPMLSVVGGGWKRLSALDGERGGALLTALNGEGGGLRCVVAGGGGEGGAPLGGGVLRSLNGEGGQRLRCVVAGGGMGGGCVGGGGVGGGGGEGGYVGGVGGGGGEGGQPLDPACAVASVAKQVAPVANEPANANLTPDMCRMKNYSRKTKLTTRIERLPFSGSRERREYD